MDAIHVRTPTSRDGEAIITRGRRRKSESEREPANDWRGRCVYMFVHALNVITCNLVASCHESLTNDRNMHRTCTSRISWHPYDGTQFTKLDHRKALLTCSVKKPSLPTWTLELRTQLKSQVFVVVVSSLYCRLSTCSTSMQRNCKQLPLYRCLGKTVPPISS